MKFLTHTILLLFTSLTLSANTPTIDSLNQLLNGAVRDTHQVNILIDLVREYQSMDVKTSEKLARRALHLSQEIGYKKGESIASTAIAAANMLEGKYREGIDIALSARKLAVEYDCQYCLAKAASILGGLYNGMTDNENAMKYMVEGLQAAEAAQDTQALGLMLCNVGFILLEDKNYKEAKTFFIRLGELIKVSDYPEHKVAWSWGYGTIQSVEGDLTGAIKNLEDGIVVAKEISHTYGLGVMHEELGRIYIMQEKYDKAKFNLLEASGIYQQMGVEDLLLNTNAELSILYNKMEEYQEAIRYGNLALKQAQQAGSKQYIAMSYAQLAIAFENQNNHQQALLYHKKYKSWSDSIVGAEKSKAILDIESKYQVTLLEEQQVKNEAKINQQKLRNLISILMLLFVSSMAFLLWNNYKSKIKYSKTLEKEVESRTKALKESNKQLTRSNEELERFAHISSHDLKEPLRNISSFVGLIEREVKQKDDPKLNQYLTIVQKNTKQMNTLIEDVLSYASITTEERVDEVDLNDVLEDVRSNLLTFINEKSAIINLHDTLPVVRVNQQEIFQVFKNLIENGIKYNETEQPVIDIRYHKASGMHHFSVADNGIGIEEEYQDKIFVMFLRLHNRDKYSGTGIGLSIVKKIIDNLDGKIDFESDTRKGTIFHFSIPDTPV